MSRQTDGETRHRRRARSVPSPERDVKQRNGTGFVLAGFILSLMALAAPLWLAFEFATNHDDWFGGDGIFFDDAVWTVIFIILFVIPVELLLAGLGFALSLLGVRRISHRSARLRRFGVAGVAVSSLSGLMMAAITVTAVTSAA